MHSRIKHPSDLPRLPCLTYRREREATTWKYIDQQGLVQELPIQGTLSSNNGELLRMAAMDGMGIALLSEPAVRGCIQDGTLVRLLPEYRFAVRQFSNGVFAVFRQSRTLPLKVRAFVDFAAEALREDEAPPPSA